MNEIERRVLVIWLYEKRCRLFILLRRRLEQMAYAPGWEKKP